MNVCGLSIDFPEIEGVSERQISYAEYLREVYITENEEVFEHIDEMINREADYKIRHEGAEITSTYFEEFCNEVKCCLFATNAGGIIATLKTALNRGQA